MNRTSKTSSTIVSPRRDLCIDFANTRYSRGSEPVETVHDFSEMVRWCDTNAMLGREAAERALQWSEKHGHDAAGIFDDAIALRETIYRSCFAMADEHFALVRALVEDSRLKRKKVVLKPRA